ncbi:MAG: hypothetical protein WCE94_00675 [Candidatus Methanoperedens sp.]
MAIDKTTINKTVTFIETVKSDPVTKKWTFSLADISIKSASIDNELLKEFFRLALDTVPIFLEMKDHELTITFDK